MSDKRDRNLNFYFSTLDTNSISASCTRLLKFTTIQATSIEIVRKQYFLPNTHGDKSSRDICETSQPCRTNNVGRTKISLKNENSQIALKVSEELENCLAHMGM